MNNLYPAFPGRPPCYRYLWIGPTTPSSQFDTFDRFDSIASVSKTGPELALDRLLDPPVREGSQFLRKNESDCCAGNDDAASGSRADYYTGTTIALRGCSHHGEVRLVLVKRCGTAGCTCARDWKNSRCDQHELCAALTCPMLAHQFCDSVCDGKHGDCAWRRRGDLFAAVGHRSELGDRTPPAFLRASEFRRARFTMQRNLGTGVWAD